MGDEENGSHWQLPHFLSSYDAEFFRFSGEMTLSGPVVDILLWSCDSHWSNELWVQRPWFLRQLTVLTVGLVLC